jgi:hypothetical protein
MPLVRDDEFFIKIYYPKAHKIVKVRSIGSTAAASAEQVKKTDLNYCSLSKQNLRSEELIKMIESGTANL